MRSGRLYSEIRPVRALDHPVTRDMWSLFERYYADVRYETFQSDLAPKDHVILLRDSGDRSLRGFSTLQCYLRTIEGRAVIVIFSGDTICDREYWGQRALHTAFFSYVMRRKLAAPLTPVYWFLITKGYKTYLLLSRNFPEHWPRPGKPTPPWQQAVLDQLAREKFGSAWVPECGILHFATPQGRLRIEVAPVGAAEHADPLIRFFEERNPGAVHGDELCCLGRIGLGMAANFGRKQLLRAIGLRGRRRGSTAGTGISLGDPAPGIGGPGVTQEA